MFLLSECGGGGGWAVVGALFEIHSNCHDKSWIECDLLVLGLGGGKVSEKVRRCLREIDFEAQVGR